MSGLMLNPRLPSDTADRFKAAWEHFSRTRADVILPHSVGIATSGSSRANAVGAIIVLSREALEVSADAVNRRLNADSQDVWGLALPLFHVGGFSIPIRAARSHSKVASFQSEWEAVRFHAWLVEQKVTLLSLVPTQLFDLVQQGLRSPPSLRAIVVGGGRLEESLHAAADKLGWPVLQSYGLTECCSQVATAMPGGDGRVLVPMDHVQLRVDESNKLWLRSQSLLSGCIDFDTDLTPRLHQPVSEDGWFETSDRAELATGSLKILGREGDVVKVLGELVDLQRVRAQVEELALTQHPLVANANWVIAVPDARKGNELVLIREARVSKDDAAALLEKLKGRLAPYEIPSRIEVIEVLPRSSLGKVLSSLLTEKFTKSV